METNHLDAQQFSVTYWAISGVDRVIDVLLLKGSEKDYLRRGEESRDVADQPYGVVCLKRDLSHSSGSPRVKVVTPHLSFNILSLKLKISDY